MKILIIDDEEDVKNSLFDFLVRIGHEVVSASNAIDGLVIFHRDNFDVVITDLRMPDMDGLELLKKIKVIERSSVEVIIITGHGDFNNAVKALQYGAYDYLQKPIKIKELSIILDRCAMYRSFQKKHLELQKKYDEKITWETLNCRSEIERLREAYIKEKGLDQIYVFSEHMRSVINMVERYSLDRSIPVLIQGESGTGKEMIARYLHFYGEGKNIFPFVALNCAAIPDNLFESELFGHESGAYTGATTTGKRGKIEAAQGGSIFFDEIGDMPINLQPKLLRLIEEGKFFKLGGIKEIPTDVRYIFSTNKNLSEEIDSKKFRLDLYYRINTATVIVPSLRERRDDIMPLSERFLSDALIRKGKRYQGFSKGAENILLNFSWPGNVRQLKNIMERLSFSDMVGAVEESDVAVLLQEGRINVAEAPKINAMDLFNQSDNLAEDSVDLEEMIDQTIIKSLTKFNGNRTKAAKYLGISRRSLHYRLKNRASLNKLYQPALKKEKNA